MVADKIFDLSISSKLVYQSDIPIKGKTFVKVFIDRAGEGTWEVIDGNDYQLINDSLVFTERPTGSLLIMQVATTPSELQQTPTDTSLLLTIKEEIKTLVASLGEIVVVSESVDKVKVVANNIEAVVAISDNMASILQAATNAQIASTSAAQALGYRNEAEAFSISNVFIVNTIEDLVTIPSNYTTAIVKDPNRGGTFIWSATGTANGGTVFAGATGYWNRQYSGAANIKWFGAKGDWDGTTGTDNTIMIQNAINYCRDIYVPSGNFAVVGLHATANGSIVSQSKLARLSLYSNGTLLTINTPNFNIDGISISGNNQGDGGFESFTTARGSNIGIYINGSTVEDINISNVKAYGFNSSAISVGEVLSASTISRSVSFTNVFAYRNYIGFELLQKAEYCTFTNCNSYRNSYALWNVGGNNKYTNCNFTNSYYNCYITTGTNDSHGGFYGCSFNHNTGNSLGAGLYVNGNTYGMEFIGCKFWYGNIKLINANGIRISNGQLAGITITVTNGYMNWIHDNYLFGTITKTFTGNHRTRYYNNFNTNDDTTTAESIFYGQYFAKSSIGTTTYNGASEVLTNLTSQSGFRHSIPDTSLYNTNFFVYPESNMYTFNILATVKATASSVNQSAKIILKIVNGSLTVQKSFTFNCFIPAGSTEQTHTFNIDTFVQAGLYAGIYVQAGDATNGFILSSLTIECRSKDKD